MADTKDNENVDIIYIKSAKTISVSTLDMGQYKTCVYFKVIKQGRRTLQWWESLGELIIGLNKTICMRNIYEIGPFLNFLLIF